MRTRIKVWMPKTLTLALALGLSACASMPPAPLLDLPQASKAAVSPMLDKWWQSFADETLNQLVEEALAHNADVQLALQGVAQSRASLAEAKWALLPEIGLGLSGNRNHPSAQTASAGSAATSNLYRGGLQLSYELDLWGRVWQAKDAASAQLLASQYAHAATKSSVAAQTARSYFALLGLDMDAALLSQTLQTRDDALQMQRVRAKAGVVGDYELQLSGAERAAVASALAQTLAAREKAEAALAVLLGRSPKQVMDERAQRGASLLKLAQAPTIPAGLPADLLRRRPDVQQAEAQLAFAEAALGEAKRRYFPSLSLTGFLGGESTGLADLLSAGARTWSIGLALAQPLVGLGRINAQVDAAKARRESAEIRYAQAARAAYGDVRSALAQHKGAQEVLVAATQRSDAQTKVKALSDLRYGSGVISYLDLLNSERDRLSAERDRLAALQQRVSALVDVYQALGGGWQAEDLLIPT